MAETLELGALFLDSDDLLYADFWLQYRFTSDLLDFQNQLLVPLLVLFLHIILRIDILLLCILILIKRVIQPRTIRLITYSLIKHFLNELILKRLVVQVNISQNLLDLIVIGLVRIHIQFGQDVLLLGLLEHLEHRIYKLKRCHCLSWKLLIRSLFLLWLLSDLRDKLVHLVVGVKVYSGQVLLELVAVGLGQQLVKTVSDFVAFLVWQHGKYRVVGLECLVDGLGEVLEILVLHIFF